MRSERKRDRRLEAIVNTLGKWETTVGFGAAKWHDLTFSQGYSGCQDHTGQRPMPGHLYEVG